MKLFEDPGSMSAEAHKAWCLVLAHLVTMQILIFREQQFVAHHDGADPYKTEHPRSSVRFLD